MRVDEMSLSGGGDAFVSGVDASVCCVNSMLADGILDLCGSDAVVSGADEPVCGVSSVMTAGELDVFGYDSVVSDETGEVVSVDDVVACGDNPLLPDTVRVGCRLSVVGDALVCGAGVARSGRGYTKAVFTRATFGLFVVRHRDWRRRPTPKPLSRRLSAEVEHVPMLGKK